MIIILDYEQRMRNDIDVIEKSTITKQIDPYPSLESPFIKTIPLDNVSSSNVWFINNDNNLETNNFVSNDSLFFHFRYMEMSMKDIKSLNLTFDISTDYPIVIEKIGIINEIDTYTNLQIPVNGSSHIDVSIDISQINNDVIVSLIEQSIFGVFVELSGGLLNTKIIISDMNIVSEFEELLQDEIDAIYNRISIENNGNGNGSGSADPDDLDIGFEYEFGLGGIDDSITIRPYLRKND